MVYRGIDVYSGQAVEIVTDEGMILSVTETVSEEGMPFLSHTLIDSQLNGYGGHDYSSPELKREDVEDICCLVLHSGTARHVPTIISSARETIVHNLSVIREAVEQNSDVASAIAGIHVEGPFISSKDGPRGAHERKYIRLPDTRELDEWLEASGGLLKIVTIAPESEGAEEFTEYAVAKGIRVSVGHAEPTFDEISRVVARGASLSTHLGNGSSAMLPRLKNHIWMQLSDDRLTAGIIADGYHLPPYVLKAFHRAKGKERLFLISDAAPLAGGKAGDAMWGGTEVTVHEDGHLSLKGTELLAGAGHLLDRGIAIYMEATGASLEETLSLATEIPSRILGLGWRPGFRVGEEADIMSFYISDERLTVGTLEYGRRRSGGE